MVLKKKFNKVIKDIKSVKIQGAENIAKAAVKALKEIAFTSKSKSVESFLNELTLAHAKLANTRPTEPFLRNSLRFCLSNLDTSDIRKLKESAIMQTNNVLEHIKSSSERIYDYGSKKIKNHTIVFTHCHSGTVIGVLKRAKKKGKMFEVHNTETRPLFQGRKTASELAKAGIKVTHYIDSAARFALKKADLMVIGCDAITSEGKIINKIGSELFAETASRMGVPVYVCSNSLKFDPETIFGFEEPIEKRNMIEVWPRHPKNVKIDNFAFEKINPELISGVITELGVFKPYTLIQEIKTVYPWII